MAARSHYSRLTPGDITRILHLLRTTELTLAVIGRRIGCSESSIHVINREHSIRKYFPGGSWTVEESTELFQHSLGIRKP